MLLVQQTGIHPNKTLIMLLLGSFGISIVAMPSK